MIRLISLFAAAVLGASLFTTPAAALSDTQQINNDVVYSECVVKVGAEKFACLRKLSGRDRK